MVVDLNLLVFFVSAELFEWFWKISETNNIKVVFRLPWKEKDYLDKEQRNNISEDDARHFGVCRDGRWVIIDR